MQSAALHSDANLQELHVNPYLSLLNSGWYSGWYSIQDLP